MSNLRTGAYGNYYGSLSGESSGLSNAEMEVNALYIYSYLYDKGWSPEAIAGVLGNMENESALNPGRWQSDDVGNTSGGFGLVQWTPATRHISWCDALGIEPGAMDSNLYHLNWEIHDGEDYYSTSGYPMSYEEFTKSTESPYYLACAFAWNYERSWVVLYGTEAEKEYLRQLRGGDAEKWYKFITGKEPIPPDPDFPGGTGTGTKTKKKRFNFMLFNKNRRNTYQ